MAVSISASDGQGGALGMPRTAGAPLVAALALRAP